MNRYLKIFIFVAAVIISAAFDPAALQADNSKDEKQIVTQEQAAKHAAKLANDKCRKEFGCSPFKPGSYKAELSGSKWRWGRIEPIGIHGYSARVEFCKDGSDEDVRVVFHTDVIDSKYKAPENETPIEKRKKIKIEKLLPESR